MAHVKDLGLPFMSAVCENTVKCVKALFQILDSTSVRKAVLGTPLRTLGSRGWCWVAALLQMTPLDRGLFEARVCLAVGHSFLTPEGSVIVK